jgi:hypothetical protein
MTPERQQRLTERYAKMPTNELCIEVNGAAKMMRQSSAPVVVAYSDLVFGEAKSRKVLSEADIDDIGHGTIRMGQTKCVILSLSGKPTTVNVTVGSFGKHEQWVYRGDSFYGKVIQYAEKDKYVYFENDLVTGWQY